jgi:hypothetical protein
VHRSDDTGDEPGLAGSLAGPGAEPASAGNLPPHAFRERIRRASVAAQAAELAPLELPPSSPPASTSSVPPEHSGVRDRPNEPEAVTLPPPVFISPPQAPNRPTPRAWPFAPSEGTPRKRALQATQLGLGGANSSALAPPPVPAPLGGPAKLRSRTPPLPAPALHVPPATETPQPAHAPENAEADRSVHDAITRPISLPMPLAAAEVPPPAAQEASYFLSEPPASPRAHDRSAEPAHAQRPSALRSSAASSEAGRYSAHDLSAEYVESALPVEPAPSVEVNDVSNLSDDGLSRARRYTPKQRPARGRARHESVRTLPGGRNKDAALARERDAGMAREREPAKSGPTSSTASEVKDARADLVRTLPDRPLRNTVPGRTLAARPSTPPAQPAPPAVPYSLPSPATNPRLGAGKVRAALNSPTSAPPATGLAPRTTALGHPASPSQYEPLPRDRAGFNAFMEQRAAEARAAGGRVHWKDQETLLVPRESLLPKSPMLRAARLDRVRMMPLLAVLALVLIGLVTFWLRRQAKEPAMVRAVPISSTSGNVDAPAVPTTLIATEPSGAELLSGGAVLGNTPVAVARPASSEETYFLRMRGFESQLVRISPQSGDAIRVTMVPLSAPPRQQP